MDVDTGFGGAFNIARTIKELIKAEATACHIEDQVAQKRCGHRPNKELVSISEMTDRLKAALDARTDENFVIMARTDAHAMQGQQKTLERAFIKCLKKAQSQGLRVFIKFSKHLISSQLWQVSLKIRKVIVRIAEFKIKFLRIKK